MRWGTHRPGGLREAGLLLGGGQKNRICKQAGAATWAFLQESLKLRDLDVLRTVPVRGDFLAKALTLLRREGIGPADGLQIATCKESGASALVSANRRLLEVARSEGLRSWILGTTAREYA